MKQKSDLPWTVLWIIAFERREMQAHSCHVKPWFVIMPDRPFTVWRKLKSSIYLESKETCGTLNIYRVISKDCAFQQAGLVFHWMNCSNQHCRCRKRASPSIPVVWVRAHERRVQGINSIWTLKHKSQKKGPINVFGSQRVKYGGQANQEAKSTRWVDLESTLRSPVTISKQAKS